MTDTFASSDDDRVDVLREEPPKGSIATAVEEYIKVRDRRRELRRRYVESDEPLMQREQVLTGTILAHLNDIGGESVRTPYGTCYRSERATASLADPDLFMRHVQDQGAFELLERKANVTAVREYVAEHKAPPPGVNYHVMVTLGVQKARSRGE